MLSMRLAHLAIALAAVTLVACSDGEDASPRDAGRDAPASATPTSSATPTASAASTSEPSVLHDLDVLADFAPEFETARIRRVGEAGDIRLAWTIADMLRFVPPGPSETQRALVAAFSRLTGQPEEAIGSWVEASNHLISSDIPAPDGYRQWKGTLYTRFVEEWAPFFEDADAAVDWRLISWGGVGIDDRPISIDDLPIEEVNPFCGCIPALDDPAVTDAAGGAWYPDDLLVFGVELNGETRAYPKHQMQVHEMVNDSLGGRRIGLVYCTLCGTAQAFLTDALPEGVTTPGGALELRTSGLLARSNKVMFDLHTFSFFDTFRGRAISGPLQDAGLELEPLTVAVATWGEWKAGHPETTIVAEDGGLGRRYPLDPLGGRDDDGPIFPVGDVDPRLPVQVQVLGVRTDRVTIAFPELTVRGALAQGRPVEHDGVTVRSVAGALAAFDRSGEQLATHQSFWFAWSQFFPGTDVWSGN